jgi:hypothetical protein
MLGHACSVLAGVLVSCNGLWGLRLSADEVRQDAAQGDEASQLFVRDLARVENRKYAEEGIPMLLACDNLVDPRRAGAKNVPEENAPLAAAFRHYVDLLPRVRASVSADDVARIVELLAEQDFAAGGKRYSR